MTNIEIAYKIASDCEEFFEDPEAYEAYLQAVQYDETLDIKYLKEAVRIYNDLTGAGIKVDEEPT